jgi:hypothetical protein
MAVVSPLIVKMVEIFGERWRYYIVSENTSTVFGQNLSTNLLAVEVVEIVDVFS